MSVQSEVSRLAAAKADIAQAIAEKGVTVPSGTRLEDMADLVRSIETVSADEVFLLAHPVGCIYRSAGGANPSAHGGTWKQVPSMGAYTWERTA